jgi:hypothetical protein
MPGSGRRTGARLRSGSGPKSPRYHVWELAAGIASGKVDVRDPLFRRYWLTFEAHAMPDMSAVELDELIVVRGLVNEITEKQPAR